MEMVRFLVEECEVDVNALDVEGAAGSPNSWGTPAAYAVHAVEDEGEGPAEVIRWLLEVRTPILRCSGQAWNAATNFGSRANY